jgi:predicted HAD superfamily hydrolase
MIIIHSFDVFDTCLIRKVAAPSCVFYETAKKTFVKFGIISNSTLVEDFVAARIQAEKVARQQSHLEDITLDEIWQKLAQSMGWQYDESFAQTELDAEEELLVPISSIRKQVQAARERGFRVIFVSDMYLPSEFIGRQLRKHGFAEPDDSIYVSGEVGKTKASGSLFRHLLAQENVTAANVLHTGDNPHSDYAVPRKLGIRAKVFSEAKLTRAEIGVLQTSQNSQATIRIAGAMRAFRMGCESEDKKNINDLASQFVAPFVMGFVTWALQRAKEDGVKRLYFMSRDCQLIWKVARELSPQFGGIDCRYLYVSRQALFLPSVTTILPEGMPWMRKSFEEPVLKNLLAKIDLKFEDVHLEFDKLAGDQRELFRLESDKDWQQFWDVLKQKSVKEKINRLITLRKKAAQKYFESAGLSESVRWSLVDFGWILTCQQSLQKLFKDWGWPNEIQGYYFGLKSERFARKEAGMAKALFYQPTFDFPQGINIDSIFSRILLLEHIIGCADHTTVHHYRELDDGNTGPAFASSVNESTLKLCQHLHDDVLVFSAKNQTLVNDFRDAAFCRDVLSSLATNFFKFPSKSLASALVGLTIAIDQNGLDTEPIVKPLSIGRALLPLLPRRRPFIALWNKQRFFWPEGSMVSSSMTIQQVTKLVRHIADFRSKIRQVITN